MRNLRLCYVDKLQTGDKLTQKYMYNYTPVSFRRLFAKNYMDEVLKLINHENMLNI